ncbi:hypothetical protein LG293_15860 (plasmid) [Citricoccus nitrophenolicus]
MSEKTPTPDRHEPNSCALCGTPKRGHGIRVDVGPGAHRWVQPPDAQRLERMRNRRGTA